MLVLFVPAAVYALVCWLEHSAMLGTTRQCAPHCKHEATHAWQTLIRMIIYKQCMYIIASQVVCANIAWMSLFAGLSSRTMTGTAPIQ